MSTKPTEKTNLSISVNPTAEASAETQVALKKTDSLTKQVALSGNIVLAPEEVFYLKSEGVLPENFKGPELTTALRLFSRGAKSENLFELAEKSGFLSEGERESLFTSSYIMASLEASQTELSELLYSAYQEPQLLIQEVSPQFVPQDNQIVFNRGVGGLRPIINEFAGRVAGIAKEKAKKLVMSAIKKGGKKIIEEGSKIAAKVGLQAAEKVAITQTIANLILPGAGGIAAAVVGFLATEVVGKAVNWLKEHKKEALALGLVAMGFLGGSPYLIAGGLAMGALFVLPFIAVPTLILVGTVVLGLIATIVILAAILYIINSGAYIVPEGPYQTAYLQESLYIGVEKTASPTKVNNPPPVRTITYTLTITAKQGTLTNITLSDDCKVLSASGTSSCPTATIPPPPTFISPTAPYTFSYQRSYSSQYRDSVAVDTLTVTADTPGAPGETATGTASVIIGNPPTSCFEFEPTNAPYFAEFQAAAVELSSHTAYAAKLCAAGPITVQLNTAGPVTTGACAGAGANSMFFDNCLYFQTHGQAFITYLFAHESGHTYSKRVSGDYSKFLSNDIPSEGYLPTYCLDKKDSEDFAETIGDYVDNGRLRPLCANPDQRPFNLCSSQFVQHCDFARNVIFK